MAEDFLIPRRLRHRHVVSEVHPRNPGGVMLGLPRIDYGRENCVCGQLGEALQVAAHFGVIGERRLDLERPQLEAALFDQVDFKPVRRTVEVEVAFPAGVEPRFTMSMTTMFSKSPPRFGCTAACSGERIPFR